MSDKLLRKVLAVVEEFRKVDPEMPAQTVVTFLQVVLDPGITVKDIEDRLQMSMSAASRNVAVLSDRPRKGGKDGEKGHGLVEYRVDPKDFRRKELFPTKRGAKVAEFIVAMMQ